MHPDEYMNVVGHPIDAIQFAEVVLAESVNIHVEVAFVFLVDWCCAGICAQHDVIYQFCVSHTIMIFDSYFAAKIHVIMTSAAFFLKKMPPYVSRCYRLP